MEINLKPLMDFMRGWVAQPNAKMPWSAHDELVKIKSQFETVKGCFVHCGIIDNASGRPLRYLSGYMPMDGEHDGGATILPNQLTGKPTGPTSVPCQAERTTYRIMLYIRSPDLIKVSVDTEEIRVRHSREGKEKIYPNASLNVQTLKKPTALEKEHFLGENSDGRTATSTAPARETMPDRQSDIVAIAVSHVC